MVSITRSGTSGFFRNEDVVLYSTTDYTKIHYKIFEKINFTKLSSIQSYHTAQLQGTPFTSSLMCIIFVINLLTQHLANSYMKPNECQKTTVTKSVFAHFEKLKESKNV